MSVWPVALTHTITAEQLTWPVCESLTLLVAAAVPKWYVVSDF